MTPRFRKWIHVILVSLLLTVVVTLAAGLAYEYLASRAEARRFPQVGRSYATPSGNLNLLCTGTGQPTVILESGLGMTAYSWFKVQPGIAQFTRVCSYDRAGYGWSEWRDPKRDSLTIVEDLHALLTTAGERPPYLLVGHSFGGLNIRVFHGRYPQEVSGLVFVDASHPDQTRYMSASMRSQQDRMKPIFQLLPLAINSGLIRMARKIHELPLVPASVTGHERDVLEYLQLQSKFIRATTAELALFPTLSADETRASGNLGDKPVIVLTAGRQPDGAGDFARAWREVLQPSLAKLSSNGRQIVVEDSTHLIPYERPDTIISAVRGMVPR